MALVVSGRHDKEEMMSEKILVVTFSDGTRWQIPALFIARHRAAYYAKLETELNGADYQEIFDGEVEFALEDEYELEDWAKNNMNWIDVVLVARRLPDGKCDYAKEWMNAEMEAVEGEW